MPIKDLLNIQDIIKDNLMSEEEIIDYIQDDFRVDLNKLKVVAAHNKRGDFQGSILIHVPHHRYELFFDEGEGILHILPYEGKLRFKHIELEVDFLSKILKKEITFKILDEDNLDLEVESVIREIKRSLGGDEKISGILVGSIWNFNFLTNLRIRKDFIKSYFLTLDQEKLFQYVENRLGFYVLEQSIFSGEISLSSEEGNFFKEGDSHTIGNISVLSKKIPDFEKRVKSFMNIDNHIFQYLAFDFMHVDDQSQGTSNSDDISNFPETKVIKNDFLSFQILRISGRSLINFGWANSETMAKVISGLSDIFDIDFFWMYGKCGSISSESHIGDIVSPIGTEYAGSKLEIENDVRDYKSGYFCCVDSPLVESETWANRKVEEGFEYVEMELWPIVNSFKKPISQNIIYYVSDTPLSGYKLSNRFDFLDQRIKCTNIILDKLEGIN